MIRWLKRMVGVMLAITLCLFIFCTGPRNLWQYPLSDKSFYKLPFPAGISHLCCQGNRAIVSHRRSEEFAYDFAMVVGSDVSAAREGVVIRVDVSHNGHGFDAPNNYIEVEHKDGTIGRYVHLKKDGSYVKVGDNVEQGQIIAASGNVGRSLLPHLHFDVVDETGRTIPVTFVDVKSGLGIPRIFLRYTSGNNLSKRLK